MIFRLTQGSVALVSFSFLFLFLPISLFVYYIVPTKYRKNTLLGISLLFILLAAPWQMPMILAASLVSYLLCSQMYYLSEQAIWQKRILLFACLMMNGILWVTFSLNHQGKLPYMLGSAVLPLLAVDTAFRVYRGEWEEFPPFSNYLLYTLFFPRLYLGPLESFQTFREYILPPQPAGTNLLIGTGRLVRGILQFSLFGARFLQLAQQISEYHNKDITRLSAWLMVLLVGLGMYHVLAGFSKMTTGIGELFGIGIPEDSKVLFQGSSIHSFINHFHKSLKDYFLRNFYRPLTKYISSPWMQSGLLILMGGLMGLWYEIDFNFFLWGLFLGVCFILEQFLQEKKEWSPIIKGIVFAIMLIISFVILIVGRTGNIDLLKALFFIKPVEGANPQILYLFSSHLLLLLLGLFFATDYPQKLIRNFEKLSPKGNSLVSILAHVGLIFLMITIL